MVDVNGRMCHLLSLIAHVFHEISTQQFDVMEVMTPVSQNTTNHTHSHRKNGVLIFCFLNHTVRVGDHITCSCGQDWKCQYLRTVVGRIWDTDSTFTTSQLMY